MKNIFEILAVGLFMVCFCSYGHADLKEDSQKITAYIQQGKYDLAIAETDRVINSSTTPDATYFAYVLKGSAYTYKNDNKAALAAYDNAVQINPNLPNAYNGRLYAYWGLKDYDKVWEDVAKVESFGGMVNAEFIKQLKTASGKSLGLSVEPVMMPPFQNLEDGRMPVAMYIRKIAAIMESKESLLGEQMKLFQQAEAKQDKEQMRQAAVAYRNIIRRAEEEAMALPVPLPCKRYYYLTLEWFQTQATLFNQIENFHHQEAERISAKLAAVTKQYNEESQNLVQQYAASK